METKKSVKPFAPEVRERAVRMVHEHREAHGAQCSAIQSIAAKIGCSGETLRNWVCQAERDHGARPGPTSEERERMRALERAVRALRQANEPKVHAQQRDPAQGRRMFCPGGARPPVEARSAFIDDHRAPSGVEPICRLLPIAPSTYHAHLARRGDPDRAPPRVRRDAELRPHIRRVWEENFHVYGVRKYGVRKVWRQLGREGFDVARCTVARLMRAMSLRGAVRGKTVKTTVQNPAVPCPLDRVRRQFHALAPNRLWVSDFTCVATWQGFVYAAFVIDACARRIAGRAGEPGVHRQLRARRPRSGHPPTPAHRGRRADRTLGPRLATSRHSAHRTPGRGRHRAFGRQRRRRPRQCPRPGP